MFGPRTSGVGARYTRSPTLTMLRPLLQQCNVTLALIKPPAIAPCVFLSLLVLLLDACLSQG